MSSNPFYIENAENMSIKKLKKAIAELEDISSNYNSEQLSIKENINSIYGVFANEYFYFCNKEIAESITGQGRHIIITTEKLSNKYFKDMWHKDYNLHKKMGLTSVEPILNPVAKYCDTDSVFISLEEVYQKTEGWVGTKTDFVMSLYKNRLDSYFKKCFQKYSDKYNSDNMLKLELEKIAHSGIWLAKKRYVLDMSWEEPDVYYESMEKVKATGGELKNSGTPKFLKGELKKLVEYIIANPDDFRIRDFLSKVNDIKERFKLQDVQMISNSITVNNYEKYVISDTSNIELRTKCPAQVRASAYYNWILNHKRSDLKTKYRHISGGEKVSFYRADTGYPDFPVFAYHTGEFPHEFAPSVDYDAQFENALIKPINRFLEAIGQSPMSKNLLVRQRLL